MPAVKATNNQSTIRSTKSPLPIPQPKNYLLSKTYRATFALLACAQTFLAVPQFFFLPLRRLRQLIGAN
jgi:hypothetical protein